MRILIAAEKPFSPIAVKQIKDELVTEKHELILLENYKDVSALKAAVNNVDALIVRSDLVTSEILDEARKLRIVVRAGAGYENIDLSACSEHKIVVMNTPGQNSNAVAELAFLMMLFQARGPFSGKCGTELRGKTIGLHAFGNVGKFMAEIARGFGMIIYAYDPFVNIDKIRASGIEPCINAEDLYKNCQYVSLHIPANEKTRKSIGYDLLMKMPQDAVLVNTARKEIIDESGLIKTFEDRSDIKYLSDVETDCKTIFEEKFKGRIIFTSKKMGAQTEEANINTGVAAARQIINYFKTGNDEFRVN